MAAAADDRELGAMEEGGEGGEVGEDNGGVKEGELAREDQDPDPMAVVDAVYAPRNRYLKPPAPSHKKYRWKEEEKVAFVKYVEDTYKVWGPGGTFKPGTAKAYEDHKDKTKARDIPGVEPGKRTPQACMLLFWRLYKDNKFSFTI